MREQLRDVEIDRRLRGRSEMEAELKQAEIDTEQQLGTYGLDDLAAAEDLLGREEAHARMEQLSAQLDGLVGKEPRETLPKLRDSAALGPGRRPAPSRRSARSPRNPAPASGRGRGPRWRGRARPVRDDEANARARVEANTVDAEQVVAQAEHLAVGREQLALLQRRNRVLESTLRAIERAETTTMKTATRYLEGHMNRDVSTVTGGRYRRVRVDDKSLDIEIMPRSAATGCRSATEPGHARSGLSDRAARARPPGHRRPPTATRVRRPVRDARRRTRHARSPCSSASPTTSRSST